jgi:hypothetical protein
LELKNQQNQVGAYAYASGQYVFFIPNGPSGVVNAIPSDKIIKSLDCFTTMLGNCTRFLRIGTNSNKTIYTNQSSTDIVNREGKEAYESTKKATGEAYESAKKATGEAWEKAKPEIKQAWDATKKTTGEAWEKAKPELKQAWDATKQGVENLAKKINTQEGGENTCDKQPIPLTSDLKPFETLYDVSTTKLPGYVDLINSKQGDNKIARVIVVEKKGMFGKVSLLKDFSINYKDGKTEAFESQDL